MQWLQSWAPTPRIGGSSIVWALIAIVILSKINHCISIAPAYLYLSKINNDLAAAGVVKGQNICPLDRPGPNIRE